MLSRGVWGVVNNFALKYFYDSAWIKKIIYYQSLKLSSIVSSLNFIGISRSCRDISSTVSGALWRFLQPYGTVRHCCGRVSTPLCPVGDPLQKVLPSMSSQL